MQGIIITIIIDDASLHSKSTCLDIKIRDTPDIFFIAIRSHGIDYACNYPSVNFVETICMYILYPYRCMYVSVHTPYITTYITTYTHGHIIAKGGLYPYSRTYNNTICMYG